MLTYFLFELPGRIAGYMEEGFELAFPSHNKQTIFFKQEMHKEQMLLYHSATIPSPLTTYNTSSLKKHTCCLLTLGPARTVRTVIENTAVRRHPTEECTGRMPLQEYFFEFHLSVRNRPQGQQQLANYQLVNTCCSKQTTLSWPLRAKFILHDWDSQCLPFSFGIDNRASLLWLL